MDIHLKRLADVLVNYSTRVKPGETVVLRALGDGEPLLKELFLATLAAGGNPILAYYPEWKDYLLLKYGSDAQLDFVNPLYELTIERADVRISGIAQRNTRILSNIAPERQQRLNRTLGPLLKRIDDRSAEGSLRWCITVVPTEASAQDAEMSLDEYEAFVFGAGLLDDPAPVERWREISARQQQLVDWLKGRDQVHLQGANADLHLSIKDRTFINGDGQRNFPDGEIFTGPVEASVNGRVRFTYPVVLDGREITGIEFSFEDGQVVKASATKNEAALLALLDTDPGARYLGELGIGTNPGITRFTRNMLFDEKIQGTFHLALGASFPETGAKNESAIHVDIVCDLHDGEIIVDGDRFYRDGGFVI